MTTSSLSQKLEKLKGPLLSLENALETHLERFLCRHANQMAAEWNSLSEEDQAFLKHYVKKYGTIDRLSSVVFSSTAILQSGQSQTASQECHSSSASETAGTCSTATPQQEKTIAQVLAECTPDFREFVETLIGTNTRYSTIINELLSQTRSKVCNFCGKPNPTNSSYWGFCSEECCRARCPALFPSRDKPKTSTEPKDSKASTKEELTSIRHYAAIPILVEGLEFLSSVYPEVRATVDRILKDWDKARSAPKLKIPLYGCDIAADLDPSLPTGTYHFKDESVTKETDSKAKRTLEFIYQRLVNVHGENPNTDYMLNFRRMIDSMRSLASSQASRWITDYPPIKVGEYLVTLKDIRHGVNRRKSARAWWTGSNWGSYNHRMWYVIAWKAMPEPMQ